MKTLKEIEEYALNNYVPIIRKANIEYLETLIRKNKLYNILELGTAIGYSAIRMALIDKQVKITTIERDERMYLQAKANVKDMGVESQINLIFDDIFNVELFEKYDLIFIDAAKAQYIKFFNKFKNNLSDEGFIVSDNLELLDLQKLTQSKRSKRLIQKMKEYRLFLNNLVEYDTEYLEIGDGFAITKKNSFLFNKILNDDVFKEMYSSIKELKKDIAVDHAFIHINNVLVNAKKISEYFNLKKEERELLYIACCLHDIGYLKGRENHPANGAILAREYLVDQKLLSPENISKVVNAIANHGGKLDSDYEDDLSFYMILADKMDFYGNRYSDDLEKFPKAKEFKKINDINLVGNDNEVILLVDVEDSFELTEDTAPYFSKLDNIFDRIKNIKGIQFRVKFQKD